MSNHRQVIQFGLWNKVLAIGLASLYSFTLVYYHVANATPMLCGPFWQFSCSTRAYNIADIILYPPDLCCIYSLFDTCAHDNTVQSDIHWQETQTRGHRPYILTMCLGIIFDGTGRFHHHVMTCHIIYGTDLFLVNHRGHCDC